MVPAVGLEPTQDCSRQILSLLCLPISPRWHIKLSLLYIICVVPATLFGLFFFFTCLLCVSVQSLALVNTLIFLYYITIRLYLQHFLLCFFFLFKLHVSHPVSLSIAFVTSTSHNIQVFRHSN